MMKPAIRLTLILAPALILMALAGCNRSNVKVVNLYEKEFSLVSLNGTQELVELSGFRGKPVVVNFWASWCIPCRQEMPFLEQSWRHYNGTGLQIIGINVLDDRTGAEAYLKELEVSFINLYDPTGDVAHSYNISALPVTLFVDKNGMIISRKFGGFIGEEGEAAFKTSLMEIHDVKSGDR